MADIGSLNPFANVSLGSMSTIAVAGIIMAIAVLVIGIVAGIVWIIIVNKKYYIKIKVFRLVGNTPTQVMYLSAREMPMGMAGDKLWRVSSAGWFKFALVKWLPVGKKQSAPNEFWYWIRKDGEWINFSMTDIDDVSEKMNVRFVQEDMRLQRLATDRLLEQRHMTKSFWDKYGTVIMTIILFLIIAIAIAIIFYQLSTVLDKLRPLVDAVTKGLNLVTTSCKVNQTEVQKIIANGGTAV